MSKLCPVGELLLTTVSQGHPWVWVYMVHGWFGAYTNILNDPWIRHGYFPFVGWSKELPCETIAEAHRKEVIGAWAMSNEWKMSWLSTQIVSSPQLQPHPEHTTSLTQWLVAGPAQHSDLVILTALRSRWPALVPELLDFLRSNPLSRSELSTTLGAVFWVVFVLMVYKPMLQVAGLSLSIKDAS